ncbi:hypothetical protein AOQ84DRAFT_148201 [Glonium stellatum]|uniref:Uncharacterized protein n=1 Tax=Glonium stellatum TaxID=574774 RepID=A0A8E2F8K7_9PEZI|nr:hypothetical protein AOQ84DRAFT_148201 [Glonium stellatum]
MTEPNYELTENWKAFEQAAKNIFKFSNDIIEIDKLNQTIKELQETIKQRDDEIDKRETVERALVLRFEKSAADWGKERESLETNLKSSKEAHVAQEVLHAKNAFKKAQSHAAREKEFEKERAEHAALASGYKEQLESCRAELDRMKHAIGLEEMNDNLPDDLERLAADLHKLAMKYCGMPLPDDCPVDALFIALQNSGFLGIFPRAIPISNSEESALLRAAALEAFVAKRLAEKMFRSLYPWSNPSTLEPNILEWIGDDFLETDPRKEAIFRSLIVSSDIKDGDNRKKAIMDMILDETLAVCAPMLTMPLRERQASFRMDLSKFLSNAAEVWNDAQRSYTRITAASESEDEDGMWEPRLEHDLSDSAVSEHQEGLGAAIKILFPTIYQFVGDESAVLHNGYALWSHQQLYITGTKEFQVQSSRVNSRDLDMPSNAMKRRSSVSQKGSFTPRSLSRSRMSMRGNETPRSMVGL